MATFELDADEDDQFAIYDFSNDDEISAEALDTDEEIDIARALQALKSPREKKICGRSIRSPGKNIQRATGSRARSFSFECKYYSPKELKNRAAKPRKHKESVDSNVVAEEEASVADGIWDDEEPDDGDNGSWLGYSAYDECSSDSFGMFGDSKSKGKH